MKDEDLMPFGKHKGTAMANVPADYLLWLYDQPEPNYNHWSGERSRNVRKYVEANLDGLRKEVAK